MAPSTTDAPFSSVATGKSVGNSHKKNARFNAIRSQFESLARKEEGSSMKPRPLNIRKTPVVAMAMTADKDKVIVAPVLCKDEEGKDTDNGNHQKEVVTDGVPTEEKSLVSSSKSYGEIAATNPYSEDEISCGGKRPIITESLIGETVEETMERLAVELELAHQEIQEGKEAALQHLLSLL